MDVDMLNAYTEGNAKIVKNFDDSTVSVCNDNYLSKEFLYLAVTPIYPVSYFSLIRRQFRKQYRELNRMIVLPCHFHRSIKR